MPVVFTLFGFMLLAFLAIVAAIIIPVFAKSREKAQQASCMSNLKQISLAMLQYSQDYDERFPPLVSALDPPNYGFIRNRTLDLSREFPPWNWRVIYSPYLRNSQLYLCPSTFDKYSYRLNAALDGKLLGQIRRPAETPGVYDIGWLGGEPPPPHNDGYNVGYVDGHVKWMHGSVEALPGR
jgi:prepilin-type processing-associated H-X9-DG protein